MVKAWYAKGGSFGMVCKGGPLWHGMQRGVPLALVSAFVQTSCSPAVAKFPSPSWHWHVEHLAHALCNLCAWVGERIPFIFSVYKKNQIRISLRVVNSQKGTRFFFFFVGGGGVIL